MAHGIVKVIVKPLVSVVLVNNTESLESVERVLHQTFIDFELIIFSHQKSDKMRDFRIQWYPLGDKTLPEAFNAGVGLSAGKYLAFLTDQTYWNYDALEVFYYAYAARVVKCGCIYGQEGEPWCLSMIRYRNLIPLYAALFTREAFEKTGGFDESLSSFEWEFCWRLSREMPVQKISHSIGTGNVDKSSLETREWQRKRPKNVRQLLVAIYQSPLVGSVNGLHPPIVVLKKGFKSLKSFAGRAIRKGYRLFN